MGRWEKARVLSVSVSAIVSAIAASAVPIVIAVLGNQYNAALKEREAQSKFVELAVTILVQPPQEENRPLRTWATEVVNRYSGVKLAEYTRNQLIDKLSFPTPVLPGGDIATAILKGSIAPSTDVRPLLAELGYYVAPLVNDADMFAAMRRTAEALQKFQADRGLPATGALDVATLEALRSAIREKRQSKSGRNQQGSSDRGVGGPPNPGSRPSDTDGGSGFPLKPRY